MMKAKDDMIILLSYGKSLSGREGKQEPEEPKYQDTQSPDFLLRIPKLSCQQLASPFTILLFKLDVTGL